MMRELECNLFVRAEALVERKCRLAGLEVYEMKRELPLRHLLLETIGVDIHTVLDVCLEILHQLLLASSCPNLKPLALDVVKTWFLQVFRPLDVIISDLVHEILVFLYKVAFSCRCVQARQVLDEWLVKVCISELGHVLPTLPVSIAERLLVARFTMERAAEALRSKRCHGDGPFAVML